MAAPPTFCDIARDALKNANLCVCGPGVDLEENPQCKGVAAPPATCAALQLARNNDLYFNWQYAPGNVLDSTNSVLRKAKLANLGAIIEKNKQDVRAQYGQDAPVDDFTFWRMQRCLENASGTPGLSGNTYIDRYSLQTNAEYKPPHLIGGETLTGRLPNSVTSAVPVMMDRLMNPTLLLVVILVILIAVVLGLMRGVSKWKSGSYQRRIAAKVDTEKRLQENNPYAYLGDDMFQVNKADEIRLKVPQYEAEGYCMKAYRQKLGMPMPDGGYPNC